MLLVSFVCNKYIIRSNSLVCLTVTIISYGISIIIKLISSVFTGLIDYSFQHIKLADSIYAIILFLIHGALAVLLFRIKRFRKGIPFLYKGNTRLVGIIISILVLLFYNIASDSRISLSIIVESLISLVIFSILLFLWWRENLTELYIERQKIKELEYAYAVIDDKDQRIHMLEADNERMAKTIHRDNKLIPSVENAVCSFITQGTSDPSCIGSIGPSILKQLTDLSEERVGFLQSQNSHPILLPKTGLYLIDMMAEYMFHKAANNGITFNMQITGNPNRFTENYITERDLCTIFADLIENSLIAVGFVENKSILVELKASEAGDSIRISDSGIPFEPHTIYSLGKKRATTHADSGGSGIGMMALFETIRQMKASFILSEYELGTNIYTKTISIHFDGKCEYRINSYRSKLLQKSNHRSDIIFN